MPRIIEPDDCAAASLCPSVEGLGLGPPHVGIKAAEPQQSWGVTGSHPHRDAARRASGSNLKELQARIPHSRGLPYKGR
jgi:hypothetical protein